MMLLRPGNLKILALSSGKFNFNRIFNKESYDFFTPTPLSVFASLKKVLEMLQIEGKSFLECVQFLHCISVYHFKQC